MSEYTEIILWGEVQTLEEKSISDWRGLEGDKLLIAWNVVNLFKRFLH